MFGLGLGRLGGMPSPGTFSPAWTPAALFSEGEVGAWYDPSDLSTMFQDSLGTTPVTADGQPVGLILDKSGRGNHATQATSTARPLYKTDGTYHWLQFDGIDDSLSTAAFDRTSWLDGMTVSGSLTNASSSVGAVVSGLSTYGGAKSHEPFSDQSWYCLFGGPMRLDAMTSLLYGTKNVLTREHQAGASSFRKNATLVGGPSPMATDFGGNNPMGIGFTAWGSASDQFNGNIYSLIVRGALSTPQEISETETWVNGKTGAY